MAKGGDAFTMWLRHIHIEVYHKGVKHFFTFARQRMSHDLFASSENDALCLDGVDVWMQEETESFLQVIKEKICHPFWTASKCKQIIKINNLFEMQN